MRGLGSGAGGHDNDDDVVVVVMEECMEAAVSKTSPGEVTRGLEARV